MDMEIDLAIELIDRAISDDLERCQTAIRASDSQTALEGLGHAITRLTTALDSLRDMARAAQD